MPITYLDGDATVPVGDGPKVIGHIVNTHGKWGAGFVLALSKRWPEPEQQYRLWFKTGTNSQPFVLGAVQSVQVEEDIFVVNMIAQIGIGMRNGPPIRLEALTECLHKLAILAISKSASVHIPRIGCGLAGSSWNVIEPMIQKTLVNRNISVYVYDFNVSK